MHSLSQATSRSKSSIFRNLTVFALLFAVEAVRRNPLCHRPTENEFDRVAAEWLRLAPDRAGGRKKRMESNHSAVQ